MTRMWIVVGDTTSGGGAVVSGSPFTDIDGQPAARKGDKVICGTHGPTTIATGDPTLIIDGEPQAMHGDGCACGCKLISTRQMRVFAADGGGGGGGSKVAKGGFSATKPHQSAISPAPVEGSSDQPTKIVTKLYWSYGDDEVPLGEESRFYTDLNIHVETSGYQRGETVEVVIEGGDGNDVANGVPSINCVAAVDDQGVAKIKNVFEGKRVELYANN
ncbi:MAG: PAAR domain-containing protein [Lysobacter sp.]